MGRPKGSPNKATLEFREAVTRFLEFSGPKLIKWLEQVEDPARRLDLVGKLAEFAHPKLGRTEVTGADGGAITVEVVKYSEGD